MFVAVAKVSQTNGFTAQKVLQKAYQIDPTNQRVLNDLLNKFKPWRH